MLSREKPLKNKMRYTCGPINRPPHPRTNPRSPLSHHPNHQIIIIIIKKQDIHPDFTLICSSFDCNALFLNTFTSLILRPQNQHQMKSIRSRIIVFLFKRGPSNPPTPFDQSTVCPHGVSSGRLLVCVWHHVCILYIWVTLHGTKYWPLRSHCVMGDI